MKVKTGMTNEQFSRIVDRYVAGQATEEEKRLIDAFFETLERKQADPNPAVSEMLWEGIQASIVETPLPGRKSGVGRAFAIVACSLLVMSVLGYFGYHEYVLQNQVLITKTAANGERVTVTLTDGTKVFLNSGSSISFPKVFDESIREVSLKGEAFFEVTRNEHQPFIVKTGDLVTRVLGTSFNIQAFNNDDISVTVATGRVQVTQQPDSEDTGATDGQTVLLDPLQQVSYQNHHFTLSYIDLEKTLAWKNNTLRFEETPMSSVGAILGRWYDVKIDFNNKDILNCRINGKFKEQRLDEVLRSIRYMYNIEYEIVKPNKIILYGKGCKK